MEVTEEGTIVMKSAPRLEAGKIVGEEEYKRIIRELDELRRKWRLSTLVDTHLACLRVSIKRRGKV